MRIIRSAFSSAMACGGNKARETLRYALEGACEPRWYLGENEGVSPNVSTPDSASIRYNPSVVKLPNWLKPETHGEATDVCIHGTGRSGWGERGPKDELVNLGDPLQCAGINAGAQVDAGNHNSIYCCRWKSEWPVVAMKRGSALGAKEPYCEHATIKIERNRLT